MTNHGGSLPEGRSRSRSKRAKKKKGRHKDKEQVQNKHNRNKEKPSHFRWKCDMGIGPRGRYIVKAHLGDGTFGRVLACKDVKSGDMVAVKVVKDVKSFCENAEAEAEILREIQQLDPERQSLCVELLDTFLEPRHQFCLVFEQLGVSLRDFLKWNKNRGMFLEDAKNISRQLLQSLSTLHRIGLIHTDLKCRNVMLRDSKYVSAPHPRVMDSEGLRPLDCRIALIDFGGAVFPDDRHGGRVGTRQFRGPEVVLGLEWNESSDIWSAGCIIAMLYLGQRPFSVHENQEHLAMMERFLETQLPLAMVKQAEALAALEDEEGERPQDLSFTSEGRLAWPSGAPDRGAVERVEVLQPLSAQVCSRHCGFLRLVQGLLWLDPKQRLTAAAALRDQFFVAEQVEE